MFCFGMKISDNINFTGIFKFDITKANCKKANKALSLITRFEDKFPESCLIFEDFPSNNCDLLESVQVCIDDAYDEYIQSILLQKKIQYYKQTYQDAILNDEIFNRIVLDKSDYKCQLMPLDVEKVEKLFKEDDENYISLNGEKGVIGNRYQQVKNYLRTGRDIWASRIQLSEQDGRLKLVFIDGRHRYAVMRDLGMQKIKFALDENSCKLAEKYNLFAK